LPHLPEPKAAAKANDAAQNIIEVKQLETLPSLVFLDLSRHSLALSEWAPTTP
jgi:hypothetical protein